MSTNKSKAINIELLLREEVYAIVGAAMEVHTELGAGFLEAAYQEALGIEFESRGIPFQPQCLLKIRYKGRILEKAYFVDFLCYGQVVVEIKALREVPGERKRRC